MTELSDLEAAAAAGRALTRADAGRVAACSDLPAIGMLGELARKARHGDWVTFVRVCEVSNGAAVQDSGEAGEVRLTGAPGSVDEARSAVRGAARIAAGSVVSGFSVDDLLRLAGGDAAALAGLARELAADGLQVVSEVPIDARTDPRATIAAVQALLGAGLLAPRAAVTRAPFAERLAAIESASLIQRETGALKAFAPLPRIDPVDQASTGYDDVRTIALARLMCATIPSIQVDWLLYGPKLAQVAIAFGADDIDRVSAFAAADLGRRRSPREEIERHIRMAFAEPVERDGRFERRS